jgi:hypothetical protein
MHQVFTIRQRFWMHQVFTIRPFWMRQVLTIRQRFWMRQVFTIRQRFWMRQVFAIHQRFEGANVFGYANVFVYTVFAAPIFLYIFLHSYLICANNFNWHKYFEAFRLRLFCCSNDYVLCIS